MKEFSRELSVVLGPTSYRLTSGHRDKYFLQHGETSLSRLNVLLQLSLSAFFLKLGSQACARTSTLCRPVSRYSIALNNLTIEERNNPV